ncbi:hypothetical protein Tco_1332767 [Tanacetum coccineum]
MASILKRGGLALLLILLIVLSRFFVKINGYPKCDMMNARTVFDEMPDRNVSTCYMRSVGRWVDMPDEDDRVMVDEDGGRVDVGS